MTPVFLALSVAWAESADLRPPHVGEVEGVVTALPTGLALANVSVTLRSEDTERVIVRTTDGDGAFRFGDLPAGLYTLAAKPPGYQAFRLTSLLVVPGIPVSEHVQLDPAPRERLPRT